jgi:GTP-binding protein HflX
VTLVVGPYAAARAPGAGRNSGERLVEATGLARAIQLNVIQSVTVPLSGIRAATYIGKGKVEELAALVKEQDVALVVMDCALSPIQQRNLERILNAKVIDRTGLILEIFGRRAHTREGLLQVELAHLTYQKSRLVRTWTHLERQRGGYGFLGGPGETQIETDRRLIQQRIERIEHELELVKRTRALHRAGRARTPYPTVAFVGYTNAGKSTLFNRLTAASVTAEDMLFATLDPTARSVRLPFGETVILFDTVGFISDLPTMLVAAFRATLEDVVSADIVLHVRDISTEESEAQAEDVKKVLNELGLDGSSRARVIELWNKADKLSAEERRELATRISRRAEEERPVLVSALTGEGTDDLLKEIDRRFSLKKHLFTVSVDIADGRAAAWLHQNTEVLARHETAEQTLEFRVRVVEKRVHAFLRMFPDAS